MREAIAPIPEITVRNLQRKMPVDVVDLEMFARKAAELCLRLPRRKKTGLAQLRMNRDQRT